MNIGLRKDLAKNRVWNNNWVFHCEAEKRSTVYTHQEDINNNRLREIHPLAYTHQEEIKHKPSKLHQEKLEKKKKKKREYSPRRDFSILDLNWICTIPILQFDWSSMFGHETERGLRLRVSNTITCKIIKHTNPKAIIKSSERRTSKTTKQTMLHNQQIQLNKLKT